MVITSQPNLQDTRHRRWWKMLVAVQSLAGANATYNPIGNEPTRRLIFKLAGALGATVTNHMPEPRLLRKLLDRLNVLSATKQVSPPALPFFSSGATARPGDTRSVVEEKMLAEFRRAASFSTTSPPAVNGTTPNNLDSPVETERKIQKRLTQIIG